MKASEIKALIEAGLPDASVQVNGDDGQHFDAVVISPSFAGKSLIEQHKMVHRALGEHLTTTIHAVQIKTLTPD